MIPSDLPRASSPQLPQDLEEKKEEPLAVTIATKNTLPSKSGKIYNINRIDKSQRFLRFYFPPFHGDHSALFDSAFRAGVLRDRRYTKIGTGFKMYNKNEYEDKPIGCYAYILFTKTLEQAEDDYEELLRQFPGKRYALDTDAKKDYFLAYQRWRNPEAYARYSSLKRTQQTLVLKRIIDYWNGTGELARAFSPIAAHRIEILGEPPEWVASRDIVILSYLPLQPTQHCRAGMEELDPVVVVTEITPELMQQSRKIQDQNRSIFKRCWQAIPSFRFWRSTEENLSTAPAIEYQEPNEEAPPPIVQAPSQEPDEPIAEGNYLISLPLAESIIDF